MVWVLRLWVACVVGVMVFAAPSALADTASSQIARGHFELPTKGLASASVYAKSLPPVGYVDFCGRGEAECQFHGGKVETLSVTSENWDQIEQINRFVNTVIRPASDMELYGKADYWTYPKDAGDCEDYVLLKKRYLTELGFNADELLITVVLDEHNEGHAILTVVTAQGDYVLDNRRREILRWDDTGYKFLKRQSQANSNEWVSLQKSAPQVLVSTRAQ